MKVNEFYKALLWSLGLNANDNGLIETDFEDGVGITVGGKPLYLPLQVHLAKPNFDDHVYFHPLSEDVLAGGESKVAKRLRKLINIRLSVTSLMLARELLAIATDNKLHKDLRPDQHVLVQTLLNANPKALRDLEKVIKNVTADNKPLLDIYIKTNGVFRDNKCHRTAIVKFYFERDDESLDFMGVEIGTKRDKKTISDLFDYIFNTGGDKEYFNFGSNDATAPYFHALLGGYMRIGNRLNELIRLFDNLLTSEFKESLGRNFKPTFSWEPALSSFASLANEIPPLPENTGSVDGAQNKVAKNYTAGQSETATAITRAETPTRGVSIDDVLAHRNSPQSVTQQSSSGWGGGNSNTGSNWGSNQSSNNWGSSNSFSGSGSGFGNNSFGQRSQPTINDININRQRYDNWGN